MTIHNTKRLHVLIAAAGSGGRFGDALPKQYHSLYGEPILRRTVQIFTEIACVAQTCVIIDAKYANTAQNALNGIENLVFIEGGKTRKESIYKGIEALSEVNSDDLIMIHDAARPFVSEHDISQVIEAALESGAATLATRAVDTFVLSKPQALIDTPLDRARLMAVQTPQVFRYDVISAAHNALRTDNNFTDDAGLVRANGDDVTLVEGGRNNFKITTQDDFIMAQRLLSHTLQTRTGLGFDVHAFEDSENTDGSASAIRLGGIDIPYKTGLKGHSDADVALHTITDALLGAIGEGDIGDHFPPSNDDFKDMDSAVFLEKAMHLARDKSAVLSNIDLTIICENPKIGPYKDQMKRRIAEILDLDETCVNVKATTTEKLGFTGRSEGVAAQAVVTIEIPRG